MNEDLKEVRKGTLWIAEGRGCQGEGKAYVQGLRQEASWYFCRSA